MAYEYRLTHLNFQNGTVLQLPNLTVFVGANNSGKSRLLKDIISITCAGTRSSPVILADVPRTWPLTAQAVIDSYGSTLHVHKNGNRSLKFLKPTLDGQEQHGLGDIKWPEGVSQGSPTKDQFNVYFGPQLIAFLTTAHRLRLVEEGPLNGAERETLLQEFYNGDRSIEIKIREIVKRAFPSTEIALDFTEPPKIELRVSTDFSKLPEDPRDARGPMQAAERLDDQGDGIRSYAGIVTALTCANRPVFLIDEPEAFLHPPQAYRLGEFISSVASARKQIIVATHSVDFLRGLVSVTEDLKVVHLDRIGNTTRLATLENSDIKSLYENPLLSSAGILNGLFFSGVVVTEADVDTRFYGRASIMVNAARDLHFVNADNKQTVPKVLAAYQKMGVRAVGIVDIDVVNDSAEFGQCLDALGVSALERASAISAREQIEAEVKASPLSKLLTEISLELAAQKATIDSAVTQALPLQEQAIRGLRATLGNLREKASIWHDLKKYGRSALKTSGQQFDVIAGIFMAHGVLINPAGELEASLAEYGVAWRTNKKSWFREAMKILPKLTVNKSMQPWKLISDVHTALDAR